MFEIERDPAKEDCYFYHTMDLPGGEVVEGDWDLRPIVDRYLGGYDFKGKRVLDLGTATGFLSFHAERQGAAEVVSYDCSPLHKYDQMPDWPTSDRDLDRLNNAYWYCHKRLGSQCRVKYGSVYDIHASLGHQSFDVAILGSLLLHLENPFGALRSASRMAKEIIVVEGYRPEQETAHMVFRPGMGSNDYLYWWYIPHQTTEKMLRSLGYLVEGPGFLTATGKTYGSVQLYTLIGRSL